jgi:hypothetical protein
MAVRTALRAGHDLSLQKIPGAHLCYRLRLFQGHSATGRIRSIKIFDDVFRNLTRFLQTCSIVPQPTVSILSLIFLKYQL